MIALHKNGMPSKDCVFFASIYFAFIHSYQLYCKAKVIIILQKSGYCTLVLVTLVTQKNHETFISKRNLDKSFYKVPKVSRALGTRSEERRFWNALQFFEERNAFLKSEERVCVLFLVPFL